MQIRSGNQPPMIDRQHRLVCLIITGGQCIRRRGRLSGDGSGVRRSESRGCKYRGHHRQHCNEPRNCSTQRRQEQVKLGRVGHGLRANMCEGGVRAFAEVLHGEISLWLNRSHRPKCRSKACEDSRLWPLKSRNTSFDGRLNGTLRRASHPVSRSVSQLASVRVCEIRPRSPPLAARFAPWSQCI